MNFLGSLFGLLQWVVGIVSVAATLALFSWIAFMILKKDKAK